MDPGFRRDDGPMSMTTPTTFNAFRIHNDAAGYRSGIEQVSLDDLAPGEVVIKTAYSSVNFKDALAGTGQGKILRRFPLVGGIDVAGHVVASTDAEVQGRRRGAGHRLRPERNARRRLRRVRAPGIAVGDSAARRA